MSGNVLPAAVLPIASGLPNWFARTTKTAESGFDNTTICFWGDSTTATALNFFGGCPLPVTYPTYAAARFVNFHQKPGEALFGTRILNFGNTGAALSVAMNEPSAAAFNITRVLTANQQIHWPAGAAPVAGDAVTIGGVAFSFVASGATGNQVNVDASFATTIDNLVAALNGSADPVVSRNRYASRSSNYDTSFALDVWSKTPGPAGAGVAVGCSSAGALINGAPVLQLPGLIVFCWGINDVRTGATTQAQLVARITGAVNRIRAVLPTTDIVLWGPNSFLSDDPTGAGLVSPATAAAAQGYSSLLYGAYEQLKNVWPNVLVLQKQDIFGKASSSFAALGGTGFSYMSDQLHPTNGAQTQMADWLAPVIGFKKPFNPQRATLARVAVPTAPYLVYPREVEDPNFYDIVAQAAWLGQGTDGNGNNYLDILVPGARYREILPGDIVQMGAGGAVFQIPLTGVTLYNLNATTTRFGFTGTGLLPAFTGGTVTVYRHKFEWDATIQGYRQQVNAYPYARRFFCPAAGAGYLRLYPLAQNNRDPANALINPATDVIVGAGGFGAVTGFTTLAFTGTANWQVSKAGTDFTALKNTYLWLFSTTPAREQVENTFEPIRLHAIGPVGNSAYVRSVATRGAGRVNRYAYSQKTAGTTDMTITLAVAGTTVLTLTIRANQVGVYQASPSTPSFPVFPGQVIEWTITGGSGAADVAVALDIGG